MEDSGLTALDISTRMGRLLKKGFFFHPLFLPSPLGPHHWVDSSSLKMVFWRGEASSSERLSIDWMLTLTSIPAWMNLASSNNHLRAFSNSSCFSSPTPYVVMGTLMQALATSSPTP